MTKFLDYVGLQKFKEWADKTYRHYSDTRIETKELIVGDNNDIRFEVKGNQVKLRADAYNNVRLEPSSLDEDGQVITLGGLNVLTNLYAPAIYASDLPTTGLSGHDKWELNNSSIQRILSSKKKKTKPKTQYIIGKAIPIGKLNGGARLNAYAVAEGMLQLKLTRLAGYCGEIDWEMPSFTISKAEKLLSDVTWHIFINNMEVFTGKLGDNTSISTGMCGAYLRVCGEKIWKGFYSLDQEKSSFALAPDMYIYLRPEGDIPDNFKGTSDALCFHEGVKVWTPKGNIAPRIDKENIFYIPQLGGSPIQLQRLYTSTRTSYLCVNPRVDVSGISYRENRAKSRLTQYGTYRYRIISNRIKTQWYTVDIMSDGIGNKSVFVIKK